MKVISQLGAGWSLYDGVFVMSIYCTVGDIFVTCNSVNES